MNQPKSQPIVCGTDFSEPAQQAADVAAMIAMRARAPLLLVHGIDERGEIPPHHWPRLMNEDRPRLTQEAHRLRSHGAAVEEVLAGAVPDEGVAQSAEEARARMIVLASSGMGATGRLLIGSVSEQIAESAHVPTLVVRDATVLKAWLRDERPLKIFVAADFTQTSEAALRWVKDLADLAPCSITAGYVDREADERAQLAREATPGEPAPEMHGMLTCDLREKARALFGKNLAEVHVLSAVDRVDQRLLALARDADADLIVTGTHQWHGLNRLRHASVSRRILHEAKVNVACVPAHAMRAPDHPARSDSAAPDAFIKWFAETGIEDVPLVGGKNASLGEMVRELSAKGVKVPNGFSITAVAYRHFLRETAVDREIARILNGLDTRDIENLRSRAGKVRHAILAAKLPAELEAAVLRAYAELRGGDSAPPDVAVRSSATAEDLPDASFAGQQETYLNVEGDRALLDTVRRCFASLFTDRAISYRADKGFDHQKIALSVGVQRMVRSDLATSGVMFTLDTESGFRDAVLINAAYGLGENVVQGSVNPDEYYVFKPTLKSGHTPILQKVLGNKEFKLIYDIGGGKMVKNVPVPPDDRSRFAISDSEILTLARWACVIEEHYSAKKGRPCPMDIEWAKDGNTGELFIVQARPETVRSREQTGTFENYRIGRRGTVLVTGRSVGTKVATGPVRIIKSVRHLDQFQAGEILVTDKTDPDWEPIMKKAAAIVTNRGGRTCHAAIVSRELGVPAIVGTERGTEALRDGQRVTISCAEGDTGFVYEGEVPFEVECVNLAAVGRPRTKVMMNVANPEEAFSLSFIPNDGVGLAREEFIITTYIKVHPLALVHHDQLTDADAKAAIERLTRGYADRTEFFVDKLAQGVAMIAAAFYPKDVILRLSDFKTNEYANLIGGRQFEPAEENPMIGFRGASRYYHPRYQDGFALECRAMKKVRDEMGLTNLKLMIPFCRTIEEGRRVQAEMARHGLRRGEGGLEIYVMCEIPSNVILAAQFAEIFDGFSIGSNDLTQLILGVDRDSEIVAPIFDERNDAVKTMIAQVIRTCREKGRKIGICGQAPSDYPEFAQFLVEQGIDSISLNPDTVLKTTLAIVEKERAVSA